MLAERSTTGFAVVLGAGVMGAGIAALLANVGWRVALLDRVPEGAGADPRDRDRLAREGLERAMRARPPHFTLPRCAQRVRIGNTRDHLGLMSHADWVVECVSEDLAAKRQVLQAAAEHAGRQAIVSSNTSGLDLNAMVAGCPEEFQHRFLGTHFFNPPRHMRPVEIVPAARTDPAVLEGFARFADRVLGKRVIRARCTPGFISTRLGMYALLRTVQIACERGLSVEEADYLTGPLIGRPRSGTFRLADVVGLDVAVRIADHLRQALPHDAAYQALRIPEIVRRLVAEGRIGAKSGAGFYRREPSGEILSLDLATGEYRPRREPPRHPADDPGLPVAARLRAAWEQSPHHDGGFLRQVLGDSLGSMAAATPEVADRIVEVDDAIAGGFGWELGPFHALDALGPARHDIVPPDSPLAAAECYYKHAQGVHFYFDFRTGRMEELKRPPEVIVLKDLRRAGRTIEEHAGAALVDLGDGVACLEWGGRMGLLSPDVISFMDRCRDRAEREFQALVLAGGTPSFSAGFDLKLFAGAIRAQDWQAIDGWLVGFQQALLALQRARVPVVGAPAGYALGGGCETLLHCAAVQAAFECQMGLPEANAGLIPAGGGTKEMLARALAGLPPGAPQERPDPYPLVRPVWEALRLARFSSSADEARETGFLSQRDGISVNPDRLLHDARERAVALADSHRPAEPQQILCLGENGYARFRWETHLLERSGQIGAHDARIALRIAYVLCGGALIHPAALPEQRLMDLEREAFLSLAGCPETLARIDRVLKAASR